MMYEVAVEFLFTRIYTMYVHVSICHCIQVLLSNGILVTFTVSKHSGDIERVLIDKTLITKLLATADNGRCSVYVHVCVAVGKLHLYHL